MACVHHFEAGKRDYKSMVFLEGVWNIAGARERFCWEVVGLGALCATLGGGKCSVPAHRVETVFSGFVDCVFIALLWFVYLQAGCGCAYLTYLKILSGAAANSEALLITNVGAGKTSGSHWETVWPNSALCVAPARSVYDCWNAKRCSEVLNWLNIVCERSREAPSRKATDSCLTETSGQTQFSSIVLIYLIRPL